jgi:hypothetical protein
MNVASLLNIRFQAVRGLIPQFILPFAGFSYCSGLILPTRITTASANLQYSSKEPFQLDSLNI